MPAITSRPIPDGFTVDYNSKIWNVGHLFRWSDFYECYLQERRRISIRPNETIGDAWYREFKESMPFDTEVFFVEGF